MATLSLYRPLARTSVFSVSQQDNADAKLRLDEALEDLEASRTANRELTRALNQLG
ncbi:hypothetical protein ACFPH6_01025 [Streptomyces xiangluensis]|uniref:Uncharacterized protein n=1 Tax=Streptomyces xiangluensis TaxID=2665720 RepID=A0ABV8YD16_9ACTN